jgi:hypothetical protein
MSQAGLNNTSSGPVPPTVATQYTEDGPSTAVPSANNLNVVGGNGIVTSGLLSTITISAKTGGFSWVETSSSIGVIPQVAYVCTAALTLSLPPTAGLSLGDTIFIYVDTASAVILQANTNQIIQIGSSSSSATGTATSSSAGSMVQLFFRPNDSTWHAISPVGSWILT